MEGVTTRDSCVTLKWASKGQRTHQLPFKKSNIKYSLLPTISLGGTVGMLLQEGSINQADFKYFPNNILVCVAIVQLRWARVLTSQRMDSEITRAIFLRVAKPQLISSLFRNCGYPVS
ncbi:hypothetical protein VP01_5889g3 [Puccinia sorghi]|uniref:Uncharacterized protein n=1 Tax=Puccinia sorghi TaxID=27349 RepID=A0A0L6UHZ1_9BASI|nr:hypothetical protein VP01_5889g3 [Puccinia sorghi]